MFLKLIAYFLKFSAKKLKKLQNLPFCHKKRCGINLAYSLNNLQLSTVCQVVIFFMRGTPQYLAHFYHFCEKINALFFGTHRHIGHIAF
jgi:hypothetical protein